MNQTEIILETRGLRKSYRRFPVLTDVSFQLKRGHILGLIGKNGAGKTTLMKTLLGLNTGYAGEIYYGGEPYHPQKDRKRARIGSLVDVAFYEDMTALQNLKLTAGMLPGLLGGERQTRIRGLLDFVGLSQAARRQVRSFSFGMKQRLALAQALLPDPELLILDEPFVGLDPVGIEDTRKLLLSLCREKGVSIVFSSHQLAEVSNLADDIVLLKDGRICLADTCSHLEASGVSFLEILR